MHRRNSVVRTAFLGVLTVAAVLVLVEVRNAVKEATRAVSDGRLLMAKAKAHLDDTSRNANAVLLQLGLAADNARRASETQQEYTERLHAILSESEKTIQAARVAIENTERSVAAVLGEAAVALRETGELSQEASLAVKATSEELAPVLQETAAAVKQAGLLLGNPETPKILENAARASESLAAASENVVRISGHVEASAAHIEKAVERSTRPASLAVKAGLWVLQSMGAVGNFFQGVMK